MKRKLLLLTAALLCTVGTWADVAPTASTPVVGNSYYLYNPQTQKFLAVNNNTPYVLDNGLEWLLEDASDGKIKIRLKNRTEGYFWGRYWANFAANYSSYESEMLFILTDLGSNTYKLRTGVWGDTESYVYINTSNSNRVACNSHAESSFSVELQKWQFITESDYITYKLQSGRSVDITSRIVNPSFEHGTNNFNGWTNTGMQKQDNDSFEKSGTYYVEAWEPSGTKSVKQTISGLPAGYYVLSADCKARSVTSAKIFAGSNEKSITIGDTKDTYSVMFYCNGSTNFEIGFEGVGTGASTSWLCVDNFSLSYYKPYISEIAGNYPSDGSLAADMWYVYTIPMTGEYYFSSTSGVVYTTNGTQVYDDVTTSDAATKVSFTKDDKVYVKSTSAQTVKIEGRFYLATTVGGVTKWLNKNASGYTYVYDRGLQFVLETSDYTNYQLKFSTGNYLNDVGSNWQTKAEGSHNNDWQLSSVDGGYKFLLKVDTSCELFVKDTSTGLVEITHSTTDGNTWKFVTPDDYANYAALADINDKITAVGTLPYADPEKKPSTYSASNSSDAASYAASLTTALRAYVESNAMGEGVGATDYTSSIAEPSCVASVAGEDKSTYDNGTWTCSSVRANGGAGYTNASGTTKAFYFDSNGWFWSYNVSSASLRQTLSSLPTGKYLLSVTSKADAGVTLTLAANDKNTICPNGESEGVFGNGWDDTSLEFTVGSSGIVEISLTGTGGTAKSRYFSADNFRLVRIGDLDAVAMNENTSYTPVAGTYNVTLTRSFDTSKWATFVVPFDIDETSLKDQFGDDVKVCTISASDKSGVSFSDVMDHPSITANTPVIMKVAQTAASYSFNGVEIKVGSTTTNLVDGVDLVANYAGDITIPTESGYTFYYIASNQLKKSTGSQRTKGFRAYFKVANDAPVKAFFDNGFNFDDADAIQTIEAENAENTVLYNLAGQRVSRAYKGLYIVNGKKVSVK